MKKPRKARAAEAVVETEAPRQINWPLLYAIGLLALLPSLWFPQDQWVYEDELLMQNPYVLNAELGNIASHRLWYGLGNTPYGDPTFRPFVLLSAIPFPKIPQGLRVLGWLMYVLTGLLLFLWTSSRSSRGSPWPYLVAALFLVHPISAELRSQILGLSEIMPLLLGATAFLIAEKTPYLGLALVALAPGFKEIGFFWVLGYSAYQFWGLHRPRLALAGVVALVVWAGFHFSAVGGWFGAPQPPESINPLVSMSFGDGLVSRLYLLGHALKLFVVPTELSADYAQGTLPLPASLFQLPVLLALAFLILFIKNLRSLLGDGAYGALVVTAVGATVFWELHLMGFTGNYYTVLFSERAWVGVYFALFLWTTRAITFGERKGLTAGKTFTAVLLLVGLFFFGRTLDRQRVWINTATLFLNDSHAHPANARLHYHYGFAQAKLSNWKEARDAFARAVDRSPVFADAHLRLATVYRELNEPDKAKDHEEKARQLGVKIPSPPKP